jgi:hypothetical protein
MVIQPRKSVQDIFSFSLVAVLLCTGVFLLFNQVIVGSHGFGLALTWGGAMGDGWLAALIPAAASDCC